MSLVMFIMTSAHLTLVFVFGKKYFGKILLRRSFNEKEDYHQPFVRSVIG